MINNLLHSGPTISVTADDDDTRSQTSTGSRGPSISVSFSAEPSAKSQRAAPATHLLHLPLHLRPGPRLSLVRRQRFWLSRLSQVDRGQCRPCPRYHLHPSCFVCAHCAEGLEHVAFLRTRWIAVCHFDYHELFSKRCFHCRTPIVDERYITVADEELTGRDGEVNERCYHELHFFCANCGDPFLDPKAAGSVAGSDPGLMTADENGKGQTWGHGVYSAIRGIRIVSGVM